MSQMTNHPYKNGWHLILECKFIKVNPNVKSYAFMTNVNTIMLVNFKLLRLIHKLIKFKMSRPDIIKLLLDNFIISNYY